MNTNWPIIQRCLAAAVIAALSTAWLAAQENDEQGDRPDGAEREGGIPRAEVAPDNADERGATEGTEEGMPELRGSPDERRVSPYFLPPDRRQWRLGIYAYNSDTGVVITRVLPDSAAGREGLEPGDRIVTVDGFQIGWVEDRLYPLGAELQRQAGRRGEVNLLVQNVRDDSLLNLYIQLDRAR
jgi:hypothetical protein